jgi:hypothetical protein
VQASLPGPLTWVFKTRNRNSSHFISFHPFGRCASNFGSEVCSYFIIYKGKPVDVKQVGRDLDVVYVLEGSVRKSGNRVRVTAQLSMLSQGIISGRSVTTALFYNRGSDRACLVNSSN